MAIEPVRPMTNMICLLRQMARPPQPVEQRQERQAEHGEMIPLDALEQLQPQAFELIAADARGCRIANGIEIRVEKTVRERADGHLWTIDLRTNDSSSRHNRNG